MRRSVAAPELTTARPSLLSVDETTDDDVAAVTVTLSWEGDLHLGMAEGDPAAARRPNLVATAALRAVASSHDVTFSVAATNVGIIGGEKVAIVLVDDPAEERPLVGAAVIETDNHQVAFARAALDAINRRLTRPR